MSISAVCHAKEAAGPLRQATGVHADERTYASLIDACARSGRADLALRVYHRALRERCTGALAVYSATIAACRADLTTTMDIYADLQRNGVQPDERLYATLIAAAGAAGRLQLAFELRDEMRLENLMPGEEANTALVLACIDAGDLAAARRVHAEARAAGRPLQRRAHNALINVLGRATRLGDAVRWPGSWRDPGTG